jgi:hypothetical protein
MNSVLDLREVVRTFRTPAPLTAYEITGERQSDGTWNGPQSAPRKIKATVFAAKLSELEILAPGEASNGGIVLETQERLYFQNATNSGIEARQSFVTYEGLTWRVLGTGLMKPLAGFHLYMAVRYMTGGVTPLAD